MSPAPGPAGRPAGRRPAARGSAGRGAAGRGEPADERFAPAYRLVTLRAPDGPLRARLDPDAEPPAGRRPMTFASRARRGPDRGPVRRFVRAYGWRAYALPVLTALTFLCAIDVANGSTGGLPLPAGGDGSTADRPADQGAAPAAGAGPRSAAPASPPAPKPTGIYVDDAGGGAARPLPPTALPAGGAYSQRGGGRYDVVPGSSDVTGTGPLRRYTVELEAGVAEDGPAFAAAVERTLGDPRSWGAGGRMSFQRVDSEPVDFRVSLTSSLTVRTICGYTLPFETSCYNGELDRAVINDARWVRGAVAYDGNLAAYRSYVINHEVGHALGQGHLPCPRAGALAPVMMQQTLGLDTAGVGSCRPNAVPYP